MVNAKNELVGIHTGTCPVNEYQRAINVHHYADWILETINEFMSNDIYYVI